MLGDRSRRPLGPRLLGDAEDLFDSFMVAGKAARPDTSILMYQAIRRVLVECEAHDMPDPIPPLRRQDYDEARKLPIEWRSTEARSKLQDLANDGRGCRRWTMPV